MCIMVIIVKLFPSNLRLQTWQLTIAAAFRTFKPFYVFYGKDEKAYHKYRLGWGENVTPRPWSIE